MFALSLGEHGANCVYLQFGNQAGPAGLFAQMAQYAVLLVGLTFIS